MKHWKLTQWCHYASAEIRYPPDRKAVFEELLQHMDDRSDRFLERGATTEEAIEDSLAAMGDPHELAPQLAAVHRPFWGYLYSVCKWAFRLTAAVVLLIALITMIHSSSQYQNPDDYWSGLKDAPFENAIPTHVTPNIIQKDSGYTFTLTEAALWEAPNGSNADLFFRLQVRGLPWLDEPVPAMDRFWMEDDLGNRYIYSDRAGGTEKEYTFSRFHSAPLTWVFDFTVFEFTNQGATWVDVHYDRDGRDMVWRIDLTGGGSK